MDLLYLRVRDAKNDKEGKWPETDFEYAAEEQKGICIVRQLRSFLLTMHGSLEWSAGCERRRSEKSRATCTSCKYALLGVTGRGIRPKMGKEQPSRLVKKVFGVFNMFTIDFIPSSLDWIFD